MKIRVEPGLFEWTKWVSGSSLPAWIPPTDLAAAHFSVDASYRWRKGTSHPQKGAPLSLLNACSPPIQAPGSR